MTSIPQCMTCKHFQIMTAPPRCEAFPNRIPIPILTNDHDHRDPYPGDHGVRYERKSGANLR